MKNLSERIKEGLKLREMKQADLVNLSGISKGALSSYISGSYEPKQRNIYKIAKALNVSESWLMGYDVPIERKEDIKDISQLSKMESQYIEDLRKLNTDGIEKAINYTKDLTEMPKYQKIDNITDLPKKEIWEKEGKEHLMPIASHDDGLTEEQKNIMNEKIAEFLKTLK